MISLLRQHTSCSSKVISASALSFANSLHRARKPWILEHPCDSWFRNVPKNTDSCGTASLGLGRGGCLRFWITMQEANVISGWDSVQHRFTQYCSQMCWNRWTLQCFRTITGSSKASASRSDFCSSRDHTRPFIFRVCHDSHHERTTIPENTSFAWNGRLFTQTHQRMLVWELLTLRSLVDRSQWLTHCALQLFAQLASSRT